MQLMAMARRVIVAPGTLECQFVVSRKNEGQKTYAKSTLPTNRIPATPHQTSVSMAAEIVRPTAPPRIAV
jgi:hypothetical protein